MKLLLLNDFIFPIKLREVSSNVHEKFNRILGLCHKRGDFFKVEEAKGTRGGVLTARRTSDSEF